ncbi:MAG: carboxypeptidase regulatory-like domain-containing protein [Armatimonadota bacterium]
MIHPTQKHRLIPVIIAILSLAALTGLAQAATITLGYGGDGVYPQAATGNSERYFRCVVTYANTEHIQSLTLGGVSGQTALITGGVQEPVTNGVTMYTVSGGTTITRIYTIGPYVGDNFQGMPHDPTESFSVGRVATGNGGNNFRFTFYMTVVPNAGGTPTNLTATGTYNTQGDNSCILDWWSGSAAGVDPISADGSVPGQDFGSSSNTYTFRVQYRILPEGLQNLLPRFGTSGYPPGPDANFAYFDDGRANARSVGDRAFDFWTYSGGLVGGSAPSGLTNTIGEYSNLYPRYDDFGDTTGYWRGNQFPEVVLIIDGDRSRPHLMMREDPADSNAQDAGGIRYFYKLLPTDYANFMDNLFLFSYDPPGPDPQDAFQMGVRTRPVSNNYVGMQVGGHTYEFLASADFSPPDGNRVWLQVGRPGNAEENQYMKPQRGGNGLMEVTQVYTRFNDMDGASGGYGYPFDSQSGTYPIVNPMLTAHPYFPRGAITPNAVESALTVNPPGAASNPFTPDTTGGPNPPVRVTNDDTILPNFVNIFPDTSVTPFRGGKWTNSATYTFRINYWQSANVAPDFIRLMVRKNTVGGAPSGWQGFTMEKAVPSDTNFTDGCVYRYLLTADQLPGGGGPGDYNYQFLASDGKGQALFPNRPAADERNGNITDPSDIGVPVMTDGSNDYYAFRVNRPPALTAQRIVDENDQPYPSGRSGDNFRFQVTYTDANGEMLNATPQGDRPFESLIWIDLFGNYLDQARTASITNDTTLTYTTLAGQYYPTNELAGCVLEVQDAPAVGKKYTIVSNDGNRIILAAGSQLLADAVGANKRFRISKWTQGTMMPKDPTDTNYADGKIYQYDSATHMVLGPGVHRYYFEFVDDWGSWLYPNDTNVRVEGEKVRYPFTGEFEGPEVLENTAPVLKDYRFTPQALSGADGTTATPFVFSVTYYDEENNPPSLIRVGVDGTADAPAMILNMDKLKSDDTVFTDGVVYVTPPIKLSEGTHIFRAQASDGTGRFPNIPADQPFVFSGPNSNPDDLTSPLLPSVPGPLVAANRAPILSFPSDDRGTDPNNPPGLDPNTGRKTDEFTYTIIYTDPDRFAGVAGNPPDDTTGGYVQVYIDNVAHTMTKVDANDNDYTDGATYQFKITGLAEGSPHTYFFLASDGLDRARMPAVGASPTRFNGPRVDEPPSPPQSLVAQDTPDDNGQSITLTFNSSPDDNGGANDVTEYRLYRSTTSGTYTTPLATIPATPYAPTHVYVDTTAVTNTDYYYIVRAWDLANESIDSNEAGPVRALDTIQPLPPTGLTASDPGLGGQINLSWNLSPDDGAGQMDVVGYNIYRATTATGFGATPLASVAAGITSYPDTSVTDNTDYFYMLRAFDRAGNESINSNVTSATQSTDQQPPIISDLYPANRALDIPADTYIGFTVSDNGTGVNQASLVIKATVGGVEVPLSAPTVTGTAQQLKFKYQPIEPFAPRSVVVVTVDVADLGGQAAPTRTWKFTIAGPQTHSISGTILNSDGLPKAGILVTAGDLSATTDAAGNYLITGLLPGTYTVKPALRGFTFTPSEQTVTVDSDITGRDFTWTVGYDIDGRVLDAAGNGMQGVTVTSGIVTTITNDTGYWRMLDLPAGSYNVVPSLPRYVFEPQSRTVTVGPGLSGLGQQFVGRLQTFGVSGVITDINGQRMSGVTVDATGDEGAAQASTNANGVYNFASLLPGQWTITPSKTNYTFKPASADVDVNADVQEVNFVGVPVYYLQLPAGLSFIALPVTPEDPNPLQVFGDLSQIGFWRYDPSINNYAISNGGWDGLRVLPGRGFFVKPQAATTLAVAGAPVARNQSANLVLDGSNSGWNMVGNPYDAALPWSNVGVTAGSSVKDFAYMYDRSTGGYVLISDVPGLGGLTSIPKNAGIWMRALATQTVPISAVSSTAAARHETWTRTAGEFVIPMVARAGDIADTTARAGVVGYARTNPQAYQIDNPPAQPGYVDVYFSGADGQMLTCDVRGESSAKMTFDFTVKTDLVNTPIMLSLPDLSQVPRDKSVTLVDVASGKRMYSRTMNSYSYNSGQSGTRQFRLEIDNAAGGGLAVTTSPAEAKGSSVGLTYTLSKPATVDVTVLNLSGRTVRVLSSGRTAAAGINTVAWDLRNQSGSRVPSGRYLVRITAAGDDGQEVRAVAPVVVR